MKVFWFCNTYQAVDLMLSWHQTEGNAVNLHYILTSTRRQKSISQDSRLNDELSNDLSQYKFWSALFICVLSKENYEIYLPHESRHLFDSLLPSLLFAITTRFCPFRKIHYYDEGLSALHLIAQTRGYPSINRLNSSPMLCLAYQYAFYKKLPNTLLNCLHPIHCVKAIAHNPFILPRSNFKNKSVLKPRIHIIASRFLNYERAFYLSDELRTATSEHAFYCHPNPTKNPLDIPKYFNRPIPKWPLEDYFGYTLEEEDIIILAFTSLLPYLLWMNKCQRLNLNLIILMYNMTETTPKEIKILHETFLVCSLSADTSSTLRQVKRKTFSSILIGPFSKAFVNLSPIQ